MDPLVHTNNLHVLQLWQFFVHSTVEQIKDPSNIFLTFHLVPRALHADSALILFNGQIEFKITFVSKEDTADEAVVEAEFSSTLVEVVRLRFVNSISLVGELFS